MTALSPVRIPLSARSIPCIDSISSSPFARMKTEAKSAVGFPALLVLDSMIAGIPPPFDSNVLHPEAPGKACSQVFPVYCRFQNCIWSDGTPARPM